MFERFRKIAVVVAHPDDEVLGTGGTIRKLVDMGAIVDLILFTDGSSAQYQEKTRQQQRKNELLLCCGILGIKNVHYLGFPDMRLDTIAHIDMNKALQPVLNDGGYECVLTHFHGDVNLDHLSVARSVQVCTRPTPDQTVRMVAAFHVASSSEWGIEKGGFVPSLYVDIEHELPAKLCALAAYEGELRDYPHPRSLDAVKSSAQFWGSQVGVMAAEPFMLIRNLVR